MLWTPNIEITCEDCMDLMARYPDKHFDLAVVDPPYGVGQHFNFRFGTGDAVYENKAPNQEYFDELLRVSKEQIVWGGNYFTDKLAVSRSWICWQKGQPIDSFSDFELSWTSHDKVAKSIKLDSYGFNHSDKRHGQGGTIHPTQKPVKLYEWIFKNYAEQGQTILDTHLGSGSIAIAAHNYGMKLTGCELDSEYYEAAHKRFKTVTSQAKLF